MLCNQCGRERSVAVSRSSKFCTQRCIINWMEANPGKTPKDAVGDDSAAVVNTTKLSTTPAAVSSKTQTQSPIPRALKKLQIDMAKPGTRLSLSDGENSNGEKAKKPTPEPPALPTVGPSAQVLSADMSVRASLIESLASIISQQQKALTNSFSPQVIGKLSHANKTPEATKVKANVALGLGPKILVDKTSGHTPKPKGSKRAATTTPTHASSAKKQKMATKGTPQSTPGKSVSFNLKPSEASEAIPSSSSIPISLDTIASYLQQPKKQTLEIKIPTGKISAVLVTEMGFFHGCRLLTIGTHFV